MDKIIEVTEWQHPSKERILKLKLKLKNYTEQGITPILFIPIKFRKFYKEVDGFIISALPEISKFLMP